MRAMRPHRTLRRHGATVAAVLAALGLIAGLEASLATQGPEQGERVHRLGFD